jgi:hypothetical protein
LLAGRSFGFGDRGYFGVLLEFVDVWERKIRDTISDELIAEIKHTEGNLQTFYEHLTTTHDRLRGELVAARLWWRR